METFGLGLGLLLVIMVISAARARPAPPPQAPRDFGRGLVPGGSESRTLTMGHLIVLAFILAGLLLLGHASG
jgi:hypothetical protein